MTATLWSSLSAIARIRPDHTAVKFGDLDETYAELAKRATSVSRVLWSLGVRPGDRVALLAANRPEYLELLYGAARIGAALVPLNTRFGVVDLRESLRRCGAKILFLAPRFRKQDFLAILSEVFQGGEPEPGRPLQVLPELERVVCLDDDSSFGRNTYRNLLKECVAQDIPTLGRDARSGGLLLFTSGSSGLPKPVMLGDRQLVRNMRNVAHRQGIHAGDRVLSFLPYFHVFGGVISTLVPILSGSTIVMMEAYEPSSSLEAAERERCTVLYSVAPCYQGWFDHPRFHQYDLSSIRTGVCSAGRGPMSAMAKRVRSTLCPMHSLFGMTETTGVVTFTLPEDSEELTTETAGCAIPGAEITIRDPATGATPPPGTEGEICVRGDMVTAGYFRLREETERAFYSNGWFRTGDQGWIGDDGYLRVIGRLDDRLRSGGENIDPREIESFVQSHPDVARCYVVGVPHRRLGEVPVAFIVAREGGGFSDEGELFAHCRGRIANFKVPRRFFFVEEVPGWMHKVQRHRLKQDAIDRIGSEDLN